MAAGKNRFAPELNEEEVITIRKRNTKEHRESCKVWHKNISRYELENFILKIKASELVKAKQCKLRQFTFLKNIRTLKHPVSSHKLKSRRFV